MFCIQKSFSIQTKVFLYIRVGCVCVCVNMCFVLSNFNGFPLSFAKSLLHQNLEMQHVFFKVLMQKGLSKANSK